MLPADSGYSMPAEWHPHQRSLVSWPVKESMCHPEDSEQVKTWYLNLILAISEFEPVAVIVNPGEQPSIAELIHHYETRHQIEILSIAHNDAWIRDNGPTIVMAQNGGVAGINWSFNAWGGKYEPWDLDDAVAPSILMHYAIQRLDAPLVMEGGSIHTDGDGTLLTTEACLLNPNRNPKLSKEDIEKHLIHFLGVSKVIWLKHGLAGDETDGHVDNIACFAAPGKVLMQICDDPADENTAITRENLAILEHTTDAKGRPIEVIPIQQPPRQDRYGKRLTLSYLNFYFVNGGIILPVFGGTASETDQQAIGILSSLYPDRIVRPIDGMPIIAEGGNVHCTTQQMPEGAIL